MNFLTKEIKEVKPFSCVQGLYCIIFSVQSKFTYFQKFSEDFSKNNSLTLTGNENRFFQSHMAFLVNHKNGLSKSTSDPISLYQK